MCMHVLGSVLIYVCVCLSVCLSVFYVDFAFVFSFDSLYITGPSFLERKSINITELSL